jgi:hypothetical protein
VSLRKHSPSTEASALRLGVRSAALAIVHELVELGLVLRLAQPIEELPELALLFLEPAQRVRAIFVEGVVAGRLRPAAAPAATRGALPTAARLVHAVEIPFPTAHASAPDEIGQDPKSDWPEEDEAEDRHTDPGGLPDVVELRGNIHVDRPM